MLIQFLVVTVKASLVHRTVIFEQWQRIARAEKGHSRGFRELVITGLFEEDPLCLGGGGGGVLEDSSYLVNITDKILLVLR